MFLDIYVAAFCNFGFAMCSSYIEQVWPPLVLCSGLPYLLEYNAQNFIPKTPTQSSVRVINEVLDFYAFTSEVT